MSAENTITINFTGGGGGGSPPPPPGGVPPPPPGPPPGDGGTPPPPEPSQAKPQTARRVYKANTASMFPGGDPDLQLDLERQKWAEEDKQRRADEKADREAARQQRETDRITAKRQREEEKRQREAEAAAEKEQQKTRQMYLGIGQASQTLLNPNAGMAGRASGALQLAGSGALGAEAEAFAAGPAGAGAAAILMLKEAADNMVREIGAGIREGIGRGADTAKGLANNDLGGMLNNASDAAAGFAEKIPIVGTQLSEAIKTTTAAFNAAGEVVDAFVKRGRELMRYENSLAQANAAADVRRVRADIREARVTGPNVSRVTEGQSQLEDLGREILTLLKGGFASGLAEVVEPLGEIAKDLKPLVKTATDVNRVVNPVGLLVRALPPVQILRIIAWVVKMIPKWEGEPEESPIDELFRAAREGLGVQVAAGGMAAGPQQPGQPPAAGMAMAREGLMGMIQGLGQLRQPAGK